MKANLPERPLVLRIGADRRRFVLETGGIVLIGRGPEAHVFVTGPLVSRRHCELRLGEKGLEMHDLGSLNGTFVNGVKVPQALLARGDVVRVGDTEIAVEATPAPGAAATSCERCGRLVSMATLEDGPGFELGERLLCAACRTGGHLANPEVERRMTATLEAEGFEVLARLSPRSSWCPVFKARRRDLDDVVALKVLPIVEELPEKKLERFKTEARVMAQLKHPNVVPVYDVRHRKTLSLIVMEFVPGETLLQRLERKTKVRTAEALRHAIGIASALEAAGKLGIVHRNVKPSNVIVTRGAGEARLIDFGLARMLRHDRGPALTDTTAPLGTLRYMAPEQMRDPHAADPRSDIYSLGATIFQAITGKLPHHEKNELELLQAAESGKPLAFDLSREEEIPQELKNVLACALMADPADRHPNATVLLEELRRAQAKLPQPDDTPPRATTATIRMPRLENGTFSGDELLEVVRKMGADGRSGTLEVKSGVRGGSLVFHDGRVIAARTLAGTRGTDAAYEVVGLYKGDWLFKPGAGLEAPSDTSLAAHALVLEVSRRRKLFETHND